MALAGAQSIALERDCKSLDSLLATGLSTAEIVPGMMVTGLVRSTNGLAAALPVVVLVAIVGGVPPLLVLLTAAGLGSSLFAAAALNVAVSVYAPSRSKAMSVGMGLFWRGSIFPSLPSSCSPACGPAAPGGCFM